MGLWGSQVLPRLIDRALNTSEVNARRALVCSGLRGRVLEIGFGSGLNLAHYPESVADVLAVEPSDLAWRIAQPRIAASGRTVERAGLEGERLPVEDASVDAVLSTYTLCSIPNVDAALREIRRVLKPDGALHFLEHGLAPQPAVQKWQHRLQPVQSRFVGGCRPDRPIDVLIKDSGLKIANLDLRYGTGPRWVSYLYRGRAVRP
ncbi:MAG TPA: class I SAM-dependent methyltransferase [Propionibacteriaceae bacterium]|nr:class I SAM-dependent methyltransferase [Propionibacteriaceae bacterium]